VDNMWLNVNSGTGSWGPFLRLGTTSEITQIELHRSDKSLE
jgi:predicted MPP superfamily phosphohydrolase